ncbi:MAG: hypothetical protein KJO10_10870, partial [Gammaproteobacteria bacterium]|nr:hypothetical protein [Gammaproteobacteria bacterium]
LPLDSRLRGNDGGELFNLQGNYFLCDLCVLCGVFIFSLRALAALREKVLTQYRNILLGLSLRLAAKHQQPFFKGGVFQAAV